MTKECGCCGVKHRSGEWRLLPLCGVQHDPRGDDLELRNCKCGSTLAVMLPRRPR